MDDIYSDLDSIEACEKLRLKTEECKQIEGKLQAALKQIEKLKIERAGLEKKMENIDKSFNSLLNTARTEIKRKATEIMDLKKRLDDICFRRAPRGGGGGGDLREKMHAPEERRTIHNTDERSSSRHRNQTGESSHSHRRSESDHSRPRSPFRESNDHGKTKLQTLSNNKNSQDESKRTTHSTWKHHESRQKLSEYKSVDTLTDHKKIQKSTEYRKMEKSTGHREIEKSSGHRKTEKLSDHREIEKSTDHRKIEKSTEHREIEKSTDHRKIEKSTEHREIEKSTDHRKFEKSIDHRRIEKSTDHKEIEKSTDYRKFEKSTDHRKIEKSTGHREIEKSTDHRKTEKLIGHRDIEKSSDHKKAEKLIDHREIGKSTDYRKIEKSTDHREIEKSPGYRKIEKLDHTQMEKSTDHRKIEKSPNNENKRSDRGDGISTERKALETCKKDKIPSRITLNAYRNRLNLKCSEEENNTSSVEYSKGNILENVQAFPESVNTVGKNNEQKNSLDKTEVAKKRTFEDVFFDELVFEEEQKKDTQLDVSEDGCLYSGLEIKVSPNKSRDPRLSRDKNLNEGTKQCQAQKEVGADLKIESNKIESISDEVLMSTDISKIDSKNSNEVVNSRKEINDKSEKTTHNEQHNNLKTFVEFLDFIAPDKIPLDKESDRDLQISKTQAKKDQTKLEDNSSSTNIIDAISETENNESASCISPYFGDQKMSAKHITNSQSLGEQNDSIENEMAVMFKESPDKPNILPSSGKLEKSVGTIITPESKKAVHNKAKEMFDLYLASPTNVIPSEIKQSKDQSPGNPIITGMKKRKSSTPKKFPGLLIGRGLKLVGHRIEGFEPGIQGEEALQATKLKNALFKDILGNENTSEDADLKDNLQGSIDEKIFQQSKDDILESPEEDRLQVDEEISKAQINKDNKIENVEQDNVLKKNLRHNFDSMNSEIRTSKSNETINSEVLKTLECLESISDDDMFSESSDIFGSSLSSGSIYEKIVSESNKTNDKVKVPSDNTTNKGVELDIKESKNMDDKKISSKDESQSQPSKEEENTNILTEENDKREEFQNYQGLNISNSDSKKSSEIKLNEDIPKTEEDIQANDDNIDFKLENSSTQNVKKTTYDVEPEGKDMKRYVEEFCKSIESVDDETVSDSMRSQASDRGATCSKFKQESIVTFSDLLKLPSKNKNSDNVKSPNRAKCNLNKSKRRNLKKAKGMDCKTEGFQIQTAEFTIKRKRKNLTQSPECKKTHHLQKTKGVYVRSLYVNSTQEDDGKIFKKITKNVNMNEFLCKSKYKKPTVRLDEKNKNLEDNKDIPVPNVEVIEENPSDDKAPDRNLFKPKMPLIRTISRKRKDDIVLSPRRKKPKIEIIYSNNNQQNISKDVEKNQKSEKEEIKNETPHCPALTKENIKKMLASLNETTTEELKESKGPENSETEKSNCLPLTKDNINKMLTWLDCTNADELEGCKKDEEDNVKSIELSNIKEDQIINQTQQERLSVDMEEAPPIEDKEDNLLEDLPSVCDKTPHKNNDNKIEEKFIELFGESPVPTPKHRKSSKDEDEVLIDQSQSFEIEVEDIKESIEETVSQKSNETKNQTKDFEIQNKEFSTNESKMEKNIIFANSEVDVSENAENCDISKIEEPCSETVLEQLVEKQDKEDEDKEKISFVNSDKDKPTCSNTILEQPIIEEPDQAQIPSTIEDDKENINSAKRKISCVLDASFEESKPTCSKSLSTSINNSNNDLKNISTSSADYRIESISSDVVNVYITRKKKKRKLK